MNNNINNDINRFDNKYLKCIVSKYKSVLNYLANSGSMIILQPQSEQNKWYKTHDKSYNRNYIYLGNEFLASGYGFLCEEMRDDAEAIVINYASTINDLKIADTTERQDRIKGDNDLKSQLDKLIQTNGGDIGNTVITIDDNIISTKDVILYGEEAHYDNLVVENVDIFVTTSNNVTYKVVDNNVMLPIGSKITNIKIEITTSDNDTGGLSQLQVIHGSGNEDENINEGVIIDYNADAESSTIIDNVDIKFNKHKYIYNRSFTAADNIIVKDQIMHDIIKGIYLYVKGTPIDKYKNYPGLLSKGIEKLSLGNVIKDNKINLNVNLNIIPQYFIGYNIMRSVLGEQFELVNFLNASYKYKEINDVNSNIISDIMLPVNKTQLNDNGTNIFYIAIPSNFVLEEIYFVKLKDTINDTNIYINEQYNIKGATYIYKHHVLLPCPNTYQIINDSLYSTIPYNIFTVMTDDANKIIDNIRIVIRYISDIRSNINDEEYRKSNGNMTIWDCNKAYIDDHNHSVNCNGNNNVLNDELFNSIYWVDAANYDNNITNIQRKLNLIKTPFINVNN